MNAGFLVPPGTECRPLLPPPQVSSLALCSSTYPNELWQELVRAGGDCAAAVTHFLDVPTGKLDVSPPVGAQDAAAAADSCVYAFLFHNPRQLSLLQHEAAAPERRHWLLSGIIYEGRQACTLRT